MFRLLTIAGLTIALAGCGGGSSTTTAAPTTPPTPTPSSPATPSVVPLTAGSVASGVDIAVASSSVTPPPNAISLGVVSTSCTGSAFNTGRTIRQGQTNCVLLFGAKLDSTMTVTVLGPADIQIINIRGITSVSGTPGLSFTAAVAGTAGLGARTVMVQSPAGDVATFTGGLEVVP
ncbi:MAG TPA: hypothetical protein VG892_00620 [Terriglobales bacterium]|nr:hypothetical protein [Terriglobales bacterium]